MFSATRSSMRHSTLDVTYASALFANNNWIFSFGSISKSRDLSFVFSMQSTRFCTTVDDRGKHYYKDFNPLNTINKIQYVSKFCWKNEATKPTQLSSRESLQKEINPASVGPSRQDLFQLTVAQLWLQTNIHIMKTRISHNTEHWHWIWNHTGDFSVEHLQGHDIPASVVSEPGAHELILVQGYRELFRRHLEFTFHTRYIIYLARRSKNETEISPVNDL